MPAGRPSKYQEDHPAKLKAYFLNADAYTTTEGDDGKVRLVPNKLPTIERFALNEGVHVDTLYEWGNKHPEFSDALRLAKAAQRDLLIQGGLMGAYKDTIAKLVLSTNHGMSEKIVQEVSGPNGGPQQIEQKVTLAPDEAYKAMLG